MDSILANLNHFALANLDDTIIFSEDLESHRTHVDTILENLTLTISCVEARMDSLAHLRLKHLKFKIINKFVNVEVTIVKDNCNRESRVDNLTHHSDPQRDPVLAIVK